MNKGQIGTIGVMIGVVTAIIGFVIINDVVVDTVTITQVAGESTNVSTGTATMSNVGKGCTSMISLINRTTGEAVPSASYNFSSTCVLGMNNDVWVDTLLNATYEYLSDSSFGGSLSRTIATYIVPIGLLGVLALAVIFARRT